MRFKSYTEQELNKMNERPLLAEGLADFEIVFAEEKRTKDNTKDMLALRLKVWDVNGREGTVFEYIVNEEKFAWKLRNLCFCLGLQEIYERGEISSHDLMSRNGKCEIGISKDKEGKYPDRNKIIKYIAIENASPQSLKMSESEFDDEIPF